MGKYVVLADCVPEEVRSFASELKLGGHDFEIESRISNWKRTGAVSELKRYGMYFAVGFRTFLDRRKYMAIVGWQQFYALIFCFFCSLFRVKKCTTVIALNYTYKEKKGKFAKIYRWFMGKCLADGYMDYLHVLSNGYADEIAKEFRFPRDRIIVTGFGVNDEYERISGLKCPEPYNTDGYALAIGRSNRDYDFLIDAWSDIAYPLVIISDTYAGTTDNPNIRILRNVAGAESEPWIANCDLMIVPIDDGSICSGDTVLLTAMSLKRKIIVTEPSTLAEMYVVNGENALLTPKDKKVFKKIVQEILEQPQYRNLGESARESFLKDYSRAGMGKKITDALN